MEAGFIALIVVITAIISIMIGIIIGGSRKKSKETQGVIYAYYGDQSGGPSLLLEYSVPIDDIASRKKVTFDVNVIR